LTPHNIEMLMFTQKLIDWKLISKFDCKVDISHWKFDTPNIENLCHNWLIESWYQNFENWCHKNWLIVCQKSDKIVKNLKLCKIEKFYMQKNEKLTNFKT